MPAKHVGQICRRCSTLEAVLTVRTEPLCKDCFAKYIHTKVIKRMEAFRTRHAIVGQERKLLLPISFGVSSISLLHILDHHLRGQNQRTGRTGFALHILFIDSSTKAGLFEMSGKIDLLRENYPQHTYSVVRLCSIFDEHGSPPASNEIDQQNTSCPSLERLEKFLAGLPSATSRSDVLSILRTRVTVLFAQLHNCEGILWGDSTTKLAEKVLAETSKGRGFSLPWQVADGMSPYGVPFYYPVRDVLKKELIAHADLVSPPISSLIDDDAFAPTQASPSSKNTTIDVLMKQYFESVEENYPSIVSNVVRTTSKLREPSMEGDQRCKLCKMPVNEQLLGIHGWGGDQANSQLSDEVQMGLCYGCARSVPQEAVNFLP